MDFLTFGFAWAGLWLVLCVFLLITRRHKEAPDYEVIAFRTSVAFVCVAIALRGFFDFSQSIIIGSIIALMYASMMNTIRVFRTIRKEHRERYTNYLVSDNSVPEPGSVEEGIQGKNFPPVRYRYRELLRSRTGMGRRLGSGDWGNVSEGRAGPEDEESPGSQIRG
jgi:hypothetical protein